MLLPYCKFSTCTLETGHPILRPGWESAAVKLDMRTIAVSWMEAVKLDMVSAAVSWIATFKLDLSFTPVSYIAAVSHQITAHGDHAAAVISTPLMWPCVPGCNAACSNRVAFFAC